MNAHADLQLYVATEGYDEISRITRRSILNTHESLEGLLDSVKKGIAWIYNAIIGGLTKLYNWIFGVSSNGGSDVRAKAKAVKVQPHLATVDADITLRLPNSKIGRLDGYVNGSLLITGRYVDGVTKALRKSANMMKPWVDDLLDTDLATTINFIKPPAVAQYSEYESDAITRANTIYNSSAYRSAVELVCKAADISFRFKSTAFQYPNKQPGRDSSELVKLGMPKTARAVPLKHTATHTVWKQKLDLIIKVEEKLRQYVSAVASDRVYLKMVEDVKKRHVAANHSFSKKQGITDEIMASNIALQNKGFAAITKRLTRFAGIERRAATVAINLQKELLKSMEIIANKLGEEK